MFITERYVQQWKREYTELCKQMDAVIRTGAVGEWSVSDEISICDSEMLECKHGDDDKVGIRHSPSTFSVPKASATSAHVFIRTLSVPDSVLEDANLTRAPTSIRRRTVSGMSLRFGGLIFHSW